MSPHVRRYVSSDRPVGLSIHSWQIKSMTTLQGGPRAQAHAQGLTCPSQGIYAGAGGGDGGRAPGIRRGWIRAANGIPTACV